jgi:hypothetical protein
MFSHKNFRKATCAAAYFFSFGENRLQRCRKCAMIACAGAIGDQ